MLLGTNQGEAVLRFSDSKLLKIPNKTPSTKYQYVILSYEKRATVSAGFAWRGLVRFRGMFVQKKQRPPKSPKIKIPSLIKVIMYM